MERIGGTAMIKCADCGKFILASDQSKWCEECFDKGLCKDMDEHFKNFVKADLEETEPQPQRPEGT